MGYRENIARDVIWVTMLKGENNSERRDRTISRSTEKKMNAGIWGKPILELGLRVPEQVAMVSSWMESSAKLENSNGRNRVYLFFELGLVRR